MKALIQKILVVCTLILFANFAVADWETGASMTKGGVYNGNLVWDQNVEIPVGKTVTIKGDLTIRPSGSKNITLTVSGSLIVEGNINVEKRTARSYYGNLVNNGTIKSKNIEIQNADNSFTNNGTLTATGNVTNGGTFTSNGTMTANSITNNKNKSFTNKGPLTILGNLENNGTLTSSKDLKIPSSLTGNGTIDMTGATNPKLTVGSANSTITVKMGNNAQISANSGDLKLGSVTVGANSSISTPGSLTTTGGTIGNNTSLSIGKNFTNGSTLTLNENLDVPGDFTNNGTITIMDSHLTVGTYDEEGGLVSGGNTENNGTINITSTSSSAQDDKVSSLISNNITNNGGADINLNSGYLVANNDINLEYRSDLNYSSGESYVVAYNNVNQESYAGVNLNNGSKGTMLVKNEYHDDSSSDNHPWGFDSSTDPFSIWVDKDFNLLIGEYFYDNNMAITGLKALYLFDGDSRDEIDELFNNLKKTGINKENIEQTLEKIEEALPIELVYFRAQQIDGNVEFTWQTASELNNDYFTIEYSLDAMEFEALATIAGAGTTTEEQNYQYTDFSAPESGTVYYRLKQTDYDGNYTYSDMVAVVFDKKQVIENPVNFVVYPNPASDYVTISGGEYQSVKFLSADGRVLKVEDAQNTHSVANMPNGVIYLVISTENGEVSKTLVKK